MARRKRTSQKYTRAQKLEILKRVQSGETQVAVAASTGVPLATVGYWARKAKGSGTTANGATRPKAKRGRPTGSRNRAAVATAAKSGGIAGSSGSAGVAWALDGDVVIRKHRVCQPSVPKMGHPALLPPDWRFENRFGLLTAP